MFLQALGVHFWCSLPRAPQSRNCPLPRSCFSLPKTHFPTSLALAILELPTSQTRPAATTAGGADAVGPRPQIVATHHVHSSAAQMFWLGFRLKVRPTGSARGIQITFLVPTLRIEVFVAPRSRPGHEDDQKRLQALQRMPLALYRHVDQQSLQSCDCCHLSYAWYAYTITTV